MATKQNDIEIEIPDDEPSVETEVAVEKTPEAVVSAEEGIDTLKKKLEQTESARRAAEARAAAAENAVVGARNETVDANVSLLTNAIGTAQQQMDVLERNYAEAMANGDYAEAGKAQREMSIIGAKSVRLEEGLQAYKNKPKEEPRPFVDPVEALASEMARQGNSQSARWIRNHPEYATDPRLYQRMLAAHNLAVTDNLTPDTDDYFESVERTLGLRTPGDTPVSEARAQRRASPPAAPVSRGGNGEGSAPRTVRLTAEQLEIAAMTGLTPEEYARNLVGIERGRMN